MSVSMVRSSLSTSMPTWILSLNAIRSPFERVTEWGYYLAYSWDRISVFWLNHSSQEWWRAQTVIRQHFPRLWKCWGRRKINDSYYFSFHQEDTTLKSSPKSHMNTNRQPVLNFHQTVNDCWGIPCENQTSLCHGTWSFLVRKYSHVFAEENFFLKLSLPCLHYGISRPAKGSGAGRTWILSYCEENTLLPLDLKFQFEFWITSDSVSSRFTLRYRFQRLLLCL